MVLFAALLCVVGLVLAYALFPAFYKLTVRDFMKTNTDLLLQSSRDDVLFFLTEEGGGGINALENRVFSIVWYEDAEFMFLPMQAKNDSHELKLKKFFGKKYILWWDMRSWKIAFGQYDDFGLAPWFYTVERISPAGENEFIEIAAVFVEFGKTSRPESFKEAVGGVDDSPGLVSEIHSGKDKDVDDLRNLFYSAGSEKIYVSFEDDYHLKGFEWYKTKESGLVYKNEFVSLTIVRTGFLETCVIRDFLKRVEASRQSYSSALDDIWRENAVEAKGTPAEKFSAARSKLNAFNARDAVEAPNLFRFIFDNVFPE